MECSHTATAGHYIDHADTTGRYSKHGSRKPKNIWKSQPRGKPMKANGKQFYAKMYSGMSLLTRRQVGFIKNAYNDLAHGSMSGGDADNMIRDNSWSSEFLRQKEHTHEEPPTHAYFESGYTFKFYGRTLDEKAKMTIRFPTGKNEHEIVYV